MSFIRDDDDPTLVLWVVLIIAVGMIIMGVLMFYHFPPQ
jgi:hypothetical protein